MVQIVKKAPQNFIICKVMIKKYNLPRNFTQLNFRQLLFFFREIRFLFVPWFWSLFIIKKSRVSELIFRVIFIFLSMVIWKHDVTEGWDLQPIQHWLQRKVKGNITTPIFTWHLFWKAPNYKHTNSYTSNT